jgi:hypothetical protein
VNSVFQLTPNASNLPKVKVELSLQYEMMEWKIYLTIYQKERGGQRKRKGERRLNRRTNEQGMQNAEGIPLYFFRIHGLPSAGKDEQKKPFLKSLFLVRLFYIQKSCLNHLALNTGTVLHGSPYIMLFTTGRRCFVSSA